MWDYRINGYWFYNNGVPTWITGTHFFYLNFWRIDIGYPKYRDTDRREFWFWLYCENDSHCYGELEIGRRRLGKSYKAGVKLYDGITKGTNRNGGIQSKTDTDSKGLFRRSIVSPWRKLPSYFKPKTDNSTNPQTKLQFQAPALKSRNATFNEDELESWIDFRSKNEYAYDGEKLYRYINDEIGKTVLADVHLRWNVVKFCLVDDDKIIGKAINTTTVEEMEKRGGKNCRKLWDESNPSNKDKVTKETISGLYRYFCPAYDGYIVDKFGNSLIEKSKEVLLAKRAAFSNDSDRNDFIRKFPFTVAEAFRQDSKNTLFNADKLLLRLEQLRTPGMNFAIPGNLIYTGKQYGEVHWQPMSNGRWRMGTVGLNEVLQNRVGRRGAEPVPLNLGKVVIGVDPYSVHQTADGKGSKGAALAFRIYDPVIDSGKEFIQEFETNRFFLLYNFRPHDIFEFYEDMIKMCLFCGCEINFENKNPGAIHYFEQKGFRHFLMGRPKIVDTSRYTHAVQTPGTPASSMSTGTGVMLWESYINVDEFGKGDGHGYVPLIDFEELIEQLLEFEPDNTTKSDLVMASIYALLGAQKLTKPKEKSIIMQNFFPRYNNSSDRAVRI